MELNRQISSVFLVGGDGLIYSQYEAIKKKWILESSER